MKKLVSRVSEAANVPVKQIRTWLANYFTANPTIAKDMWLNQALKNYPDVDSAILIDIKNSVCAEAGIQS